MQGKTFNKETNIKSDGELIKRHSTLSYGQLKEDFSYESNTNLEWLNKDEIKVIINNYFNDINECSYYCKISDNSKKGEW